MHLFANLVIHLSNAKQLAFRLCTILRSPAGPVVPGNLVKGFSTAGSRAEPSETSFFAAAPAFTQHHDMNHVRQQACLFPAGVVTLVSGEVEHIVHLIRWNLNSCLCHCGTTCHHCGTTSPRSRRGVTHDFCCRWNWVLF